ncbi:MAG: diguanylate cyclase [Clostridiales bacterium]|nr:diguanylate cyclase [Clostridiales bacterium]
MNEVLKALKGRRSIRQYKKEQIKDEQLKQILEAGMYAPSGMGAQPAIIVVVQDEKLIKKLSKLNAKFTGNPDDDPFYGAPTLVIVLADSRRNTYIEDGSLVMGNLMNAAFSLGVDSCWIHRAKEMFQDEEGQALLKEWGIDDYYVGIGNCILGYRDCEQPEPKPRKEGYIIRL